MLGSGRKEDHMHYHRVVPFQGSQSHLTEYIQGGCSAGLRWCRRRGRRRRGRRSRQLRGKRTAEEGHRHSRGEDRQLSNESILCSQIPISLGINEELKCGSLDSIFQICCEIINPGKRQQADPAYPFFVNWVPIHFL